MDIVFENFSRGVWGQEKRSILLIFEEFKKYAGDGNLGVMYSSQVGRWWFFFQEDEIREWPVRILVKMTSLL